MKKCLQNCLRKNEFYLFVILLLICAAIGLINGSFFTAGNVVDLVRTAIPYGIFAVGIMIVVISGGIDISFPAVATLSTYATLSIFIKTGYSGNLFIFLVISCAFGLVLGLVNGFFIAYFKFPSLIVTLATQSLYYGIQYVFLGSKRLTSLPEYISDISRADLFAVVDSAGMSYKFPVYFVALAIILLLAFLVLRYTMIGRGIYALGGSEQSAERVGFKVKFLQMMIYGSAGVIAAIGGVVYTIVTRQSNPASLLGMEMTIISIAVLGGIDIAGGKGSIFGLILGTAFFTVINNSLILIGLNSYWKTLVLGIAMFVYASAIALKNKIQQSRVHEIDYSLQSDKTGESTEK